MKKLLASLVIAGLATVSNAAIVNFHDHYDPADFLLTAGTTFTHEHNILDDGFDPHDYTVIQVRYSLFVRDDQPGADGGETIDIDFDGDNSLAPIWVTGTFYTFLINPTLVQTDGRVSVAIKVLEGDLLFKDSHLAVKADTVPEPGAMALFGLGLLGLGYIVRRRKLA